MKAHKINLLIISDKKYLDPHRNNSVSLTDMMDFRPKSGMKQISKMLSNNLD